MGLIILLILAVFNISFNIKTSAEYSLINFIIGSLNISILFIMWLIIYFSIHFFENFQKAKIDPLRLESMLKDFELKLLKSQLNPHFIFNVMNSIRALLEENPEKAKDSIIKLSNLIRYTLKVEHIESVPLS